MKKILTMLVAAICAFGAFAQTTDIQAILDNRSNDCPISLSDGMTMISANIDGQNIIYIYGIDNSKVSFATLKQQKEMLHDVMASDIATTKNADTKRLATYCQTTNSMIILRFVDSGSQDHFDIVITPQDLTF